MQNDPVMDLSDRPNLGQSLTTELRRLITDGELADEERINEVHLSRDLGVSRTPLREALTGLAAEGYVVIRPRRGFFVAPLDSRELADLYSMRALLDPHALALAGIPTEKGLAALTRLNSRLRNAAKPRQIVELDNEWHRTLIAQCPNQVLLQAIDQYIALTQRYELVYFRETAHLDTASREHDEVLAAAARNDLVAACDALRRNLQSAVKPLQAWMETRRA